MSVDTLMAASTRFWSSGQRDTRKEAAIRKYSNQEWLQVSVAFRITSHVGVKHLRVGVPL